ncbi:hypothetical protein BJ138DRAFT_1125766 [Hygrophoropsis aurantiaca]|uniref:Uncharacterized protein n=1 Tax=Hygrophoropsis aurantiaca TaxID=72124 RepID=A0ACB8AEY6_9AGAM|nr:hypothetical protein BJ138DRAFT_1125766 [Hygrophoropsis aurantiaca]
MARPQQDAETLHPRFRQRSNTTTFASFSWRRAPSRPEVVSSTATAVQSQPLSFEALVAALTPPAVPSLHHARSLASSIVTQSPLPAPASLNPVLASLCTSEAPSSIQTVGFEIMSAYWERSESKLGSADRLAYFALFLNTTWSSDIGEPRLKALRNLTKGGTDVVGIEVPLLNLLKTWIEGAFDAYISCDPTDLGERCERERSLEVLAAFMSSVLEVPETIARVSEGDLASVLQFHAGLAVRALDIPSPILPASDTTNSPASSLQNEQSPTVSSSSRPFTSHRRHPSSVSIRSLPPSLAIPQKHPAELMVTLYLDHLSLQLKTLPPRFLALILPVLFRAQAFFASPLPRLSITSGRPQGPPSLEDRTQKMLNSLFTGPYSTSCMMILKRYLFPPKESGEGSRASASISVGAHRTLRNDIRRGLSSRMARAYISRLSSVSYTPSGAPGQIDLEKELMERAWSKDDISGWDLAKLGRLLCRSVEAWVTFGVTEPTDEYDMERDRMMEEAAGTLKDIFQEFDVREDGVDMNDEEATITGETLRQLASYVRTLKNPDGTPLIIPLSQPNEAPTPFLRTLASLLARDHSTFMAPLLSTTLLSIADNLTDIDTAKLPTIMFEQHDLSPASPDWLSNWKDIFSNATLFGPMRQLTRMEIMKALQAVYDSLKDMQNYRIALAELVYKLCEKQSNEVPDDRDQDSAVIWRILGDEAVLRSVEGQNKAGDTPSSSGISPSTTVQEMIDLLTKVALEGVTEDDDDTASVNTSDTQSPTPYVSFSTGTSTAVSPILSRKQSEYKSSKDTTMPSVMSILSSLAGSAGSRSQSLPINEQEDQPSEFVASPPPERILPRSAFAVVALVHIFSQLAFTPYSLSQSNADLAKSIFLILVKRLLPDAKCARARLTILQFMMRLRADRDHRLYFVEAHYDAEGHIYSLASLIGRCPDSSITNPTQGETEKSLSMDNSEDLILRRARPHTAQERNGRRASRGRGIRPTQSASSRSRSRAPLPPTIAPAAWKPQDTLWSIPELVPFASVDSDTPSEGLVSYDPLEETDRVLPIAEYLLILLNILEKEKNWEILSYILCYLPMQLSNKHLFCGPKCREIIPKLLTSLCSGVASGEFASCIDRWPPGLKARDAHGLVYHTLTVLISYRRCFDVPLRHALIDVFREGLNGQPSTIICCLHALSLSAFELLPSLKRCLPTILEKLSQIMSNPDMAVHILSLLTIIGSIRDLHANLREDDFKMVFGVALQYLQHHNRPGATPSISWALSQHVRMISFYVVYLWFLAVKLTDRPRHIPFITRQLLLANEGKADVDEPTEVCFDWLARYTFASADPRPAHSALSDIVMSPSTSTPSSSPEPAISEKTWVFGNSIVTIRTLTRLGWIEVLSRRPSGFTRFLCKLENVPLVGPGEVAPDNTSIPAGLMMNRDPTHVPAPSVPPEAAVPGASHVSEETKQAVEQPTEDSNLPAPDSITGYVWSGTAPSQRRKHVAVDPSFLALQLSPYPDKFSHLTGQRVLDPSLLPSLFRSLDQKPVIDTHKVGIMYVAPGQTHELDILRNTHGSPAYTRFLEGIGRLINIRGQADVYAGGLDPDEDGEYAYAWWDDIGQILYHTATMMPTRDDDPYCVGKKSHIGNDYVRIVWNDSGLPYRFDTLATQFQFVNIVIEPHSLGAIAAFSNNLHENEYFKVTIQRAPGMHAFTPVGCFKLISAENLPLLVRQLSLLADWFASVFRTTERDTAQVEVVTNWRARLQTIQRFKEKLPPPEVPGAGARVEGVMGQEAYRNFTTSY